MKTFTATPDDIHKKWVLIDAEGIVLGRLATIVASILRGKNKPTSSPPSSCVRKRLLQRDSNGSVSCASQCVGALPVPKVSINNI